MQPMQVLWTIIGIIFVLAIIAVLIYLGRRRKDVHDRRQREMDRGTAAEMRQGAEDAELDARDAEVTAARTQLSAEQAAVDADRLRVEAERQEQDAQVRGAESVEQRRQADALDPDTQEPPRDGAPDDHEPLEDNNGRAALPPADNQSGSRHGEGQPN